MESVDVWILGAVCALNFILTVSTSYVSNRNSFFMSHIARTAVDAFDRSDRLQKKIAEMEVWMCNLERERIDRGCDDRIKKGAN